MFNMAAVQRIEQHEKIWIPLTEGDEDDGDDDEEEEGDDEEDANEEEASNQGSILNDCSKQFRNPGKKTRVRF